MSVPGEYERYNFKNRSPPKDPPEEKITIFSKTALMVYIQFRQLMYNISPLQKTCIDSIFRNITLNALRAQMLNANFFETVFIGQTDFIAVRYSVTISGLQSKN
jgi:hypothetical protein